MYRLFYDKVVSGDILFVLISPEKKTSKTVKVGDLALLYSGEELTGINLFNASKVYPIASKGIIYAQKKELIDALNKVLVNAKVAPLPYLADSGFHLAKISAMEEHPLDEKAHILTLSLGSENKTTVSWYPNLSIGALVVVALDGTILRDGSVFHSFVSRNIPNEVSLMGSKDLGLPEGEGAYLATSGNPGDDFFLGGK
jgi:tRNA-binding EMAP/Myf-like protein